VKNFENRLTFGEVIGMSLVSCFFDSRCISPAGRALSIEPQQRQVNEGQTDGQTDGHPTVASCIEPDLHTILAVSTSGSAVGQKGRNVRCPRRDTAN